jgi:hypothetical protein
MCYRRATPVTGEQRWTARHDGGWAARLGGASALGFPPTALWLLALLLTGARPAGAAEVTRVVSALDDDNRFDLNLTISWLHESKSALIKREWQSDQSPQTQIVKDLEYLQTRNILDLRADFGILWDVGLHVEAPIVLSDDRRLDFDQKLGGDCIYPGQAASATCVNSQNSTILRDGILPGFGQSSYGIDAAHNRPFTSPDRSVFRGPTRSGLEYLGMGLTWAPFNQARDDTKPTWTVSFDSRFDVGADMRFDPLHPGANTAVGLGYHQFIWSTAVSKRFRHFEPYFGAWYNLPVRSNGGVFPHEPQGSQSAVDPQQRAGVQIGVEQIAWENRRAMQRVTIELRGRAEEHFFGRSHSELWEALSGSPACANDATQCRRDPSATGGANFGIDFDEGNRAPYPGVTETQAYATVGGDAGLNVQVGQYVRFRGLFGLTLDEPHFITYANSGADTNGDGRIDLGNRAEKNPVYRETIDNPGRRFKVEGTEIWSLFLEGSIMF